MAGMMNQETPQVLVLLIGEVLDDPRVYKTCRSLADTGSSITVICTTRTRETPEETVDGLRIIRVPHYRESVLKRLHNTLQRRKQSPLSGAAARLHEEVPSSHVAAFVRNCAVMLNHLHVSRATRAINRQMVRRVTGLRFDLVHANDVDTLAAGAAIKHHGIARELLYDAHEFWPGIGVHGSLPNRANQRLESRHISSADYVVTVNKLIAERMRDLYDLPGTPAVVMNCPRADAAPDEMCSVHDPVRVLYQGKLQAFRGLEVLIRAFRNIHDAMLTVSGYGPIEERLKQLADSEGLAGRVRFTGRFAPADTIRIASAHDIGVLPFSPVTESIELSSPNKLFDYLMAGLAVATTDLPFLTDIITRHDAGTVFPGNTPERIAEAVNALVNDPVRLTACKQRARDAARDGYTWERQFANYPWSTA